MLQSNNGRINCSGVIGCDDLLFDIDAISVPVDNRINLGRVADALRAQGLSGAANDIVFSWLSSKGYTGQFNDVLYMYLEDVGLDNCLTDKWAKWKVNP